MIGRLVGWVVGWLAGLPLILSREDDFCSRHRPGPSTFGSPGSKKDLITVTVVHFLPGWDSGWRVVGEWLESGWTMVGEWLENSWRVVGEWLESGWRSQTL